MPVELGTTNIIGSPSKGGFNFNVRPDDNPQWNAIPLATRMDMLIQENIADFTYQFQKQIDAQHDVNMQNIDNDIDKAVKNEGGSNKPMDVTTPKEAVTQEHVIHVKLYYNSKAEGKSKADQAASLKVGPELKPHYDVFDLFPNYEYKNTEVRKQKLIDWALGYEAFRLSQVYAETARRLKEKADALAIIEAEQTRIAAEAEAQRVAAEAAAKAAADKAAAEAIRVANTFPAQGSLAVNQPLFTAARGMIAIEGGASALATAIQSAIAGLARLAASAAGAAAGTIASTAVGVAALLAFPRELANGELPERYTFSTPLSDLAPDLNLQTLQQAAATAGTVDISIRVSSKTAEDGRSEVFVVRADGVAVPSKVRVATATYNAEQKVYTATTADVPPRTLTWTPAVSPGNSSTSLPAETALPPVYNGATITPVEGRIDTFPEVADASFDDYIMILPVGTGFVPVYVMFRDRREDPGVATGTGQPVSGLWLGAAAQGQGAPIPSQIADQLRGQQFKNWREFREALWKAVANDAELTKQFDPGSLAAMKKGYSAFVRKTERVGGRIKYELHHKQYISLGGDGRLQELSATRLLN